jgi:hypothetical protein
MLVVNTIIWWYPDICRYYIYTIMPCVAYQWKELKISLTRDAEQMVLYYAVHSWLTFVPAYASFRLQAAGRLTRQSGKHHRVC